MHTVLLCFILLLLCHFSVHSCDPFTYILQGWFIIILPISLSVISLSNHAWTKLNQYQTKPTIHIITVKSHEHHCISNHQHLNCLFNSLFRLTPMETSKLCITGPMWGESTHNWWFRSQRASDAGSFPYHDGLMYVILGLQCTWLPAHTLTSNKHCQHRHFIQTSKIPERLFQQKKQNGKMWQAKILQYIPRTSWNLQAILHKQQLSHQQCNYLMSRTAQVQVHLVVMYDMKAQPVTLVNNKWITWQYTQQWEPGNGILD